MTQLKCGKCNEWFDTIQDDLPSILSTSGTTLCGFPVIIICPKCWNKKFPDPIILGSFPEYS